MFSNPLIQKAIDRIPEQLRREDFRFVPIWVGEKKPFEWGWNIPGGKNNYRYYDPKFAAFLLGGHNWGTCTGIGDLVIFDSDHKRLGELGILEALPNTFTVKTGGGGTHRYYICTDIKNKVVMYDRDLKNDKGEPQHLGEIQTLGFQAVGPGSLHPNNTRYQIENDVPIATVSWQQLHDILAEKIEFGTASSTEKRKKHFAIKVTNPSMEDPFEDLNIEDIIYPSGDITKHGSIIKGSHPMHGSKHGCNFQIDIDENTWFCFRCWKGGGPALAVAVTEKLISCDKCGKGALRGDLYSKTVQAARERGYIKPRRPLMKIERWEE